MKQHIYGTVPAYIEVYIPDDTPEDERVGKAVEIYFESNPKDFVAIPDFMNKDFNLSE